MQTNYIRHQISGWPRERVSIKGNNRGKWWERSPGKFLEVMDVSVILIVVVWLHEWKQMPKPNKLYIWNTCSYLYVSYISSHCTTLFSQWQYSNSSSSTSWLILGHNSIKVWKKQQEVYFCKVLTLCVKWYIITGRLTVIYTTFNAKLWFNKRNSPESGHRGNTPQHNKGYIWQTQSSIILNGETLKAFPSKITNKNVHSLHFYWI